MHAKKFIRVWAIGFVLILVLAGCGLRQSQPSASAPASPGPTVTKIPAPSEEPTFTPTSLPTARWLFPASDIKALAEKFDGPARQSAQAWNSHDLNAIRKLYTEDVVHYDGYPRFVGIDDVMSMASQMIAVFPNYGSNPPVMYIGHEDVISAAQYWGVSGFTKDHPGWEYDQLKTRDGRVYYWRLFYDPDYLAQEGITLNTKLLEDYAAVWSSGDPQRVAAFYSPAAERKDALFGDLQQGRDAIRASVADFFAWYPGVSLEMLQPFGETLSNEITSDPKIMQGGIYAVHVKKADGSPCDVRVLVLLETNKVGVVSEQDYYNADSLLACGWTSG